MKKIFRTVQLLANVSVIVLSIVVSAVLINKYFFPQAEIVSVPQNKSNVNTAPTPQTRAAINPVGKSFPLTDISWQDKNLVLYLSTNCRYCTESAGFYKRLVKEIKGKNIKLVAVLPQPEAEGKAYLKEKGIEIEAVSSPLTAIGVSATPTLLAVDRNGNVTEMWRGKQSLEGEERIISSLLRN